MSYALEWRIKRMLEIGNVILHAGRGGGRIYVATPVIKIQNSRKQYYTDDWRWQEGLKVRGQQIRMKRYLVWWESIAFPNMGLPEYVYAESPEEAKAKAEAEAEREFKVVYYVDDVKEAPKYE